MNGWVIGAVVSQIIFLVVIVIAALWPEPPSQAIFVEEPAGQETNLISTALMVELQELNSPLLTYYLGARIENGVATVYFRSGVEAYFNLAPGQQVEYFGPIVDSLYNIRGVKKIQWMVDGKPFDNFDA